MNVPWRFILALPLGVILGISIFIAFLYTQLGTPTETSHYIGDVSLAKEKLAISRSGPRLLIVAGSSGLFGFNAQLIEQQTGLPTINMGTAMGLSLDYRFYRLEKILRPGDTVLLAFEYESYTDNVDYETTDDYVLGRDPDYFRQLSLPGKIYMATRVPFKRLQKGWKNQRTPERVVIKNAHSPYSPFSAANYPLDDNGDEMLNFESERPAPELLTGNLQRLVPNLVKGMPSQNTAGFAMLAEFIAWAHAHHVAVLATFPNIIYRPVYDEPNGQEAIQTINQFYATHDVPVVGTAREAMQPADQFFDFMYHLTHQAALKRTERLIPELQPYLHPSK